MLIDTLDQNLVASGRKNAQPPLPEEALTPPSRRKKVLKAVSYTAIFFVSLLFFFYLKTPSSLVQGLVLNTLNQSGPYQWQADSVSTRLLLLPHLKAENLNVSPRYGVGMPPVTFKELRLYPSLLSLIPWTGRMNPSVSFDGEAYGAKFSGTAAPQEPSFSLSLTDADFARLIPLKEAGIDIIGVISSLEANLTMPGQRLSQATGTVAAKGKNMVVDPAALRLPLPLPILDLGALDFQARVDQGKLKIERMNVGSPGKDLEIRGTGDIQLADNLNLSRVDLRLRLKPSEKILNAMPSLRGMLGSLAALGADGFYAMKFSGTLGMLGLPQPDR